MNIAEGRREDIDVGGGEVRDVRWSGQDGGEVGGGRYTVLAAFDAAGLGFSGLAHANHISILSTPCDRCCERAKWVIRTMPLS